MKKIPLSEINYRARTDPHGFIAECEEDYSKKIYKAAAKIRDRAEEHPVVLLSGPSGSGKTTSAERIETQLESMGINSHTISMDDYFHTRTEENTPRDENGEPDLESPLCLDMELLNDHIRRLARGQEIMIPRFDFETQSRTDDFRPLVLGRNEIVVVEGIHALNPAVMGEIREFATGVYVSMRSCLVKDDGKIIEPEHLRAMRRILRDNVSRGRNAAETLSTWDTVRRGELLYIFPHKSNADISIDSLIPYEGCVTVNLAAPLIRGLDKILPEEEEEAAIVQEIVDLFYPIPREAVPAESILNEFIAK